VVQHIQYVFQPYLPREASAVHDIMLRLFCLSVQPFTRVSNG